MKSGEFLMGISPDLTPETMIEQPCHVPLPRCAVLSVRRAVCFPFYPSARYRSPRRCCRLGRRGPVALLGPAHRGRSFAPWTPVSLPRALGCRLPVGARYRSRLSGPGSLPVLSHGSRLARARDFYARFARPTSSVVSFQERAGTVGSTFLKISVTLMQVVVHRPVLGGCGGVAVSFPV